MLRWVLTTSCVSLLLETGSLSNKLTQAGSSLMKKRITNFCGWLLEAAFETLQPRNKRTCLTAKQLWAKCKTRVSWSCFHWEQDVQLNCSAEPSRVWGADGLHVASHPDLKDCGSPSSTIVYIHVRRQARPREDAKPCDNRKPAPATFVGGLQMVVCH